MEINWLREYSRKMNSKELLREMKSMKEGYKTDGELEDLANRLIKIKPKLIQCNIKISKLNNDTEQAIKFYNELQSMIIIEGHEYIKWEDSNFLHY